MRLPYVDFREMRTLASVIETRRLKVFVVFRVFWGCALRLTSVIHTMEITSEKLVWKI